MLQLNIQHSCGLTNPLSHPGILHYSRTPSTQLCGNDLSSLYVCEHVPCVGIILCVHGSSVRTITIPGSSISHITCLQVSTEA